MEETKTCPKCNSKMEKGLMTIPGSPYGIRWQKSSIEPKKWKNIFMPKVSFMDSYKCVECGYIESYVK